MTYPFTTTVQYVKRTRNGSGSAYSGTEWTDAAAVATEAVWAPGGSAEVVQGGDVVTTQPTLYAVDRSLGVSATDKFIVNGTPFEVDGDPQDFLNPYTGDQPGLVVRLRKVTG
jgi:hypothetical protein